MKANSKSLSIIKRSLPGDTEIWCGVAERAEQIGYCPTAVVKHRSQLGKWVKKYELESQKEKRLCNGTQREINVYKVSDRLDQAIHEYFRVK